MTVVHHRLRTETSALEAFHRLYGRDRYGFLCESLGEVGTNRYSFFGGRPRVIHRSHETAITIEETATGATREDSRDLLASIRALLATAAPLQGTPPFSSGVVGYLGYDIVRRFERLPSSPPDPEGLPDSVLLVPSEIVIVDHHEATTDIVIHGDHAPGRIEEIGAALVAPTSGPEAPPQSGQSGTLRAITPRPQFEQGVSQLLEHIRAGDIFQGVLSQRFETEFAMDPFDLYRSLRVANPAPYMYFLKLGEDHAVLGSSPEILVSLEGDRALTRPLAGTKPRGETVAEDSRNATDLLADEKERAEHVMLVDLARNDLGRVCDYGTVKVTRQFEIERHARVMHIVSEVEGRLSSQHDALDLLQAAFPAGTVTGAPKIRAMEILDTLEPVRRGLYGGAIGYIDPAGRMDLCLAIRTLVFHRGRVLLQAGAGVVADSDPAREYEETRHKASALVQALAACAGPRSPLSPTPLAPAGAPGSNDHSTSMNP